jgi:tripartite-type tricarboxylate transporter receptor subunit TctC
MTLARRQLFRSLAGAVALLPALSLPAFTQSYPSKPITMIVPFAAGGSTDVIGRILAERMRSTLGQTVIVENVTGAGGTIGVGRAVRAAPDGYTVILGQNGSHVITGATYSNLPYNLLTDFEPISLATVAPFVIVAKKATPPDDLKSLIAWLKANPGKTVGNAGQGSITHVAGLVFEKTIGANFQFVPYRGTGPSMQDLVAGQIDMMIADPITALPQVRGGTIKVYGVAAEARLTRAPGIPTVDEAGLPGFHMSLWHGLWAPKGTPKPVIDRLHAAVLDALADPATRTKLAEAGQEIFPRERQNPAALGALQKTEIEKWWPIIKASGFKVQ